MTVSLGDPPRTVLDDISISLEPGVLTLLVGRNGSGKSVLLRALLGLLAKDRGTIMLDGTEIRRDFSPLHRVTGVLFQNPDSQIFGETVRADIELTLAAGSPFPTELVRRFGLFDRLNDAPPELSGGKRRLVALAAALASNPRLLVLDEPLAELDLDAVLAVRDEIARRVQAGAAALVAVHDTRDLWHLAGHVVLLDGGVVRVAGEREAVRPSITAANGLREPELP